MNKYKIVAKNDHLALHSSGYYGKEGRKRAQDRCDSGYCAKYWSDKKQAKQGFVVIVDK